MIVIKKLLNNEIFSNSQPSQSVVSAALIITVAGLASRILGLIRDRFLAATFGAGDTLDIYYAAFRIPDLIYNFLILGALSAAFIPVFTGLISRKKEKEAWETANGVMNLAISFVIILSLAFCFFAPQLMKIITPGFPPEKMAQTVFFTRIMFLSPVFLGISGIFGGILTSFKRFLIYSLAPILYNLGIILGVVFFVKLWGPVGLAWGVALGAFLHMLIQYPMARHLGFRYSFSLRKYFFDKDIRRILKLMIPRMMGIAASQANLFVITIFASTLAAGSLAIFSFAQNLQAVPLGIFGVSFAIAVFPTLSALSATEDKKEFAKTFAETFCQIMFFVIPLSIFILLLRAQIVRVALGAGKFDWEDTILTYQCLKYFSLSLFAQSAIPLLTRSFYAMQNTKTPFYIAIVSEIINIVAAFLLVGKYEVLGLAIAFSLAGLFQMFFLFIALRFKFDDLGDKKIIKSISKIALAAVFSGIGTQISKYFMAAIVDMDTFLGVFAQLFVSGIIGLAIFLAICHFIKLEEYWRFKQSLTRKLFKSKNIIAENIGEVSGV
ncbi:TPA: murein biosynthesis integral membrane protein MurJ [Candidatus Moranbacteria bacterium]|nr:murein biosynthesis integral membrane protein MurJ [Candidatus Moranbacteria bacterium]